MMVKTKWLRELISLAIASTRIKNEKPVSILIIAKPESGKTATLKEFSINNGVIWISDITYTGILNVLDKINSGTVKTLLIPDLLKVLGRKKSTVMNLLTLLNELIEEGIKTIMTYGKTIHYSNYLVANIIGAITSKDFFMRKDILGGIGFLSRVIPFSYKYSVQDINKIFETIMKGENSVEFQRLKLPSKAKEIILSKKMAERIKSNITLSLANRFKYTTKEEIYGFRFQKNLQTLAKASALLRKSKKVSIKDVRKLEKISNWMNFEFYPLGD